MGPTRCFVNMVKLFNIIMRSTRMDAAIRSGNALVIPPFHHQIRLDLSALTASLHWLAWRSTMSTTKYLGVVILEVCFREDLVGEEITGWRFFVIFHHITHSHVSRRSLFLRLVCGCIF